MIIQRKRGLQAVSLLAQGTLITVVFVLCALMTFSLFTSVIWDQISHYPIYIFAITAGLFLESIHRDQSGTRLSQFEDNFIAQNQLSLRQTLYVMGSLFAYLVAAKDGNVSRIFLALCFPMFYLAFLWSNRYFTPRIAKYLFSGTRKGRVLLIGSIDKASLLREWLRGKAIFGIQTVGILDDSPAPQSSKPIFPYLGKLADAENVIQAQSVIQVILLELPDAAETYRKLIPALERRGVGLLILNNLEEKVNHPVCYFEDDGHHFVSLRMEPLENPLNRISKRILDIFIALPIVLFILPPICLAVWLIQRLYSPGPLFFWQTRAGLQNNLFEILKFRTMHVNNPDAARQASRNDERIYRGGRILRKLSIDELPQFWNVLHGHMSVVGPRPHLIEHNEQFAKLIANFPIRKVVKPGITGMAQVRGFRGEARTSEAIGKRLESDIEYLENWRLTLDIMIVIKTIFQVFSPPPTAY